MRRLLVLGCCVAYLAFDQVAGIAHVHGAADHHEKMRGLHLDHAHVGEASDHGPKGHDWPAPPENGDAHIDARHVGHHGGDARYLTITARRSLHTGLRVMPAMVAVGATNDPPALISTPCDELPDHLRGPPREGPIPPRAPPA